MKKGDTNMEKIEFKEYRDPAYWMRRRAIHAFIENIGPVLICVGTLVAFFIMGFIEVCL